MFRAGGFTMMLSWDANTAPGCNPQEISLCAALQALIAYADGQENSSISVSSSDGCIVLTGEVETLSAFERAVIIAECFASRPIIADLAIRQRPSIRLDAASPRLHLANNNRSDKQ
ncbi:BON domain-containing protein [Rhizobium rhizogenes]|uniref:BON domain-containing protein n=2 Tax=Rhizobium/Agrobacterium group TaxID=227290 RepID=A0AA88EXW1_RHIRH|nr:BON domain-containing protein [Rhizobium rhizogenes]MQB12123.1 BON domain-containing protein [Agrobacterium sp. ICMP 6402]